MIRQKFDIPKYEWTVYVYYSVHSYYRDEILDMLDWIRCPKDIMKHVNVNLSKNNMDTGFTYSSSEMKSTVMVIGTSSNYKQLLNSIDHESRHLVDDISKYYDIDSSGEEVAYLTGYIGEITAPYVKLFICDCNCCKEKLDNLALGLN